MYDVIVVGARCAGATLATLLARSGARTLLLDANAMPSGMPMSTHFLHAPAMAVLDEIGIGDAIRARTAPIRQFRLRVDDHELVNQRTPDRYQYCPRRSTLDPLLHEAATRAGAEAIDRARVTDVIVEAGRVAGVVANTPSGSRVFRAPLVVGADGRHSAIARLVGAPTYLSYPMTRSAYWFYCREPAFWQKEKPYTGWQTYMGYRGRDVRYVFQCDDGLLLLLTAPPADAVKAWNGDYRNGALDNLRGDDVTQGIVDASPPAGKGVGLLKADFFFRRAAGPGWALVGDAGTFKDFVTGHGITDALLGATRLHRAILDGSDAAYERYWRERDVTGLPLFFDALRAGGLHANDGFLRMLARNMARDEGLAQRLIAISDRELSPLDAFRPGELLRMLGGELVRGRFGALRPFVRAVREVGGYRAEIARRARLLEALPPGEVVTADAPFRSALAA